jgi:hypothetical protein
LRTESGPDPRAITSLTLGFAEACTGPPSPTCWGVSNFVSKANLTNLITGASIASGATLTINLTDKGEPGSADSFSVDLRSGSTILFSSNWSGTLTSEQVLGGGNLVVH